MMPEFKDALFSLCAREMRDILETVDTDVKSSELRISAMVGALETMLGRTIGTVAFGDAASISTALMESENNVAIAAAQTSEGILGMVKLKKTPGGA